MFWIRLLKTGWVLVFLLSFVELVSCYHFQLRTACGTWLVDVLCPGLLYFCTTITITNQQLLSNTFNSHHVPYFVRWAKCIQCADSKKGSRKTGNSSWFQQLGEVITLCRSHSPSYQNLLNLQQEVQHAAVMNFAKAVAAIVLVIVAMAEAQPVILNFKLRFECCLTSLTKESRRVVSWMNVISSG